MVRVRYEDKGYPKDTLGMHWRISKLVFGADSKAVKWLEKKASESPSGMDGGVIQEESQVIQLLVRIHEGKSDVK